jgi:hypothetical protein
MHVGDRQYKKCNSYTDPENILHNSSPQMQFRTSTVQKLLSRYFSPGEVSGILFIRLRNSDKEISVRLRTQLHHVDPPRIETAHTS